MAREVNKGKCCSVEGCDRPAIKKALCNKHYTAKWFKEHPGASSEYCRKRRYDLNREQFDALLEIQNHACGLCNQPLGESRETHTDHCHISGKVRSLLHLRCNTILEFFEDHPGEWPRADHYLANPPAFNPEARKKLDALATPPGCTTPSTVA